MGIFNFRREHKNHDKTIETNRKETPIEKKVPAKTNHIEEGTQDFSARLDGLKKAMTEMESQGLEINEGVFENIMKMNVGDFMEYINGGENIKEADVKSLHDNISKVLNGELNESYNGSKLKNFLRRPATKIAFVTLLLFLKFAPHSQAAEAPAKDLGDTNTKTEKFDGGNDAKPDGNTYTLTGEDFEPGDIENIAVMDLTNSYETDMALISEADANKIKADFGAFLNKVNSQNFNEVMKLDFKIYGSSDERPTSTWKGGNLELTEARIAAAEEILLAELNSHDFSSSDLTPEQIKQLQDKEFKHGVPEDGVTHITDLVNPDTGVNYTEKEVAELKKTNLTKYNDLLRSCRYIKVNLMAKAGEELKPMPILEPQLEIENKIEMTQITINLISSYDQTIIIFDNSPSMHDSRDYMAEQLKAGNGSANIKVATFSDNLDAVTSTNSFYEAGEALKNIPTGGSSHERSILAANEALTSYDMTGNKALEAKLLLINTDEAIQTTKAEMDKLLIGSQMKGVKVYFNLGYDENQQIIKISLNEMKDNFDKLYEKKLEKIQADIDRANEQLNNPSIRGDVRQVVKDRLENLEEQLKELPNLEFKIRSFELPDGRIINMAT